MFVNFRLRHRGAVAALKTLCFVRVRAIRRIVEFNAQATDCACQFLMTQQKLDHPEILGFLVDQVRFCSSHGMCAVK